MNKPVATLCTIVGATFALAASSISPDLEGFATAIHSAQSLRASYQYIEVNGLRTRYDVALKKPNLVRLDEPKQLIVADGKNIVTFNKQDKTYYKEPETDETLNAVFKPEEVKVWGGFFKANAYQPFSSKDMGAVTRGSESLNQVSSSDEKGVITVDYFLDPGDKIVRQVETNINHGGDKATFILRTSDLTVNSGVTDDLFTFTPPDGSSEMSMADVLASKWFLSLSDAEKIANASGRKIFVDFMATWCGPCKMLAAQVLDTPDFHKYAADHKLVLCRLDVDLNPELAAKYAADAIPQQDVLDANGNVVSQKVGYLDSNDFYSWLKGAVGE